MNRLPKSHPTRRRVLTHSAAVIALSLSGLAPAAQAQSAASYPSQQVRIIVPYSSGGATDALARLLANQLQQTWGQPVIVENKTGAGGIVGNDYVAKAPADGYTILISITAMVQGKALYPKLPYNPVTDFKPLTAIARSASVLVVNTDVPAKTFPEFLALAKANPRYAVIGNYGAGTSAHIYATMLAEQTCIAFTHIPYRGEAPLSNDLLGGQTPAGIIGAGTTPQQLATGRIRALAVTGTHPLAIAPNIPTFGSLGYKGLETMGWFGVFVRSGTPQPIADKIAHDFIRIIKTPEMQERIKAVGVEPGGETPEVFAAEVRRDTEIWGDAIRRAGVRLD